MCLVIHAWVWLRARYRRLSDTIYNKRRNCPVYLRRIELNPDFPRMSAAPCQESEYPYRDGTAVVFRVAGKFGLTLGLMHSHVDMSDKAINTRLIRALQSADGTRQYWDTPERRRVAEEHAGSGEYAWRDRVETLTEDTLEGQ